MKIHLNEDFVVREINGDFFAVPVNDTVLKHNVLLSLNPTGKIVFEEIIPGSTKANIVKKIFDLYEAPIERIESDVELFISNLKAAGFDIVEEE